ncbi:hypothetical protein ACFL4T_00060 [candidate division KSB1 bacterium]
MKKNIFVSAVIIIFVLFSNCSPNKPEIIELLKNGDFEAGDKIPKYWGYGGSDTLNITGAIDTESAIFGEKCLKIESSVSQVSKYGMFYQTVYNVPAGKNLTFSIYMKTYGKTVGNISAHINVQKADHEILSYHFIEIDKITSYPVGWKRYSISIDTPEKTQNIRVYLWMAGNGTGWFDKVSLTYEE